MMSFRLSETFQVLLFLSLLSIFQSANADLIGDVCAKAKDRDFCDKTLRSDPRAPKADIKGLTQISIDISKTSAQSGVTLVTSLLNQATDPRSKEIYNSCLENYKDAVSTLDDCTNDLKKGDYPSLNSHASAAITDPDTCDDNFNKVKADVPKEPSQLIDESKKLQSLSGIILAASSLLKGS